MFRYSSPLSPSKKIKFKKKNVSHLELFSKGKLVDGVGHVRVLRLCCGTMCRHVEVSRYLNTNKHIEVGLCLTPQAPARHLVS